VCKLLQASGDTRGSGKLEVIEIASGSIFSTLEVNLLDSGGLKDAASRAA